MLARRYGVLSGLLVAGSTYWAIELSIDSSLLIRFGSWSHVLGIGIFVLIISVIPLLTLRARSDGGRMLALVTPLALALLVLGALPPLAYAAYTNAAVNASEMLHQLTGRAIYAMQILAAMAFALSLYGDSMREGEIDSLLQRGRRAQLDKSS